MGSNIQLVYRDEAQDKAERKRLVTDISVQDSITDSHVLQAMFSVPRHFFVPSEHRAHAYRNQALPLANGQTISQPYIVALAAEVLCLSGQERVLEIGGGSGYQAAVLSLLAKEVYAVEQDPELNSKAVETLSALSFDNVHFRCADGKQGWPAWAPFDRILVSCAAGECLPAWYEQLKPGGYLVFPHQYQRGQTLERWERGVKDWRQKEKILSVKFVPLL